MFEHLPETFPERDEKKKPALFGSAALHFLAVLLLLAIPLWMPYETISPEFVTALYLPPPPPPAAPAAATVETRQQTVPRVNHHANLAVDVKPERPLLAPTAIPKDIAALADLRPSPPQVAIGSVPGGVYGGLPGGVLGGIAGLSEPSHIGPPVPPPPPPQPKATEKTYKVGGDVKEPRLVKYVRPLYPPLARNRKITGIVVLEATVTKSGRVADVRVISGDESLAESAIKAVRQWEYEPTQLNGVPVPVVLRAKVDFELAPS